MELYLHWSIVSTDSRYKLSLYFNKNKPYVGFDVLTAVVMKSRPTIFWAKAVP
jgi:hypothetical protein